MQLVEAIEASPVYSAYTGNHLVLYVIERYSEQCFEIIVTSQEGEPVYEPCKVNYEELEKTVKSLGWENADFTPIQCEETIPTCDWYELC